ncbi:MAG TPA: outer membrane beta-barrel protein [Acidisarcina sp.]
MLKKYLALGTLLLSSGLAHAQVVAASTGGRPALYAGGYYSNFNSDFKEPTIAKTPRLSGAGVFVDWNVFGKLGVEGEARFLRFNQTNDFHSDHYLVGPRYSIRRGNYRPYVKLLLGAGELNFPYSLAHGGYFDLAAGGGLDYRLSRRFGLRGDYEYQFWPTAPGLPGAPSHGLSPNGFSAGISYRIF